MNLRRTVSEFSNHKTSDKIEPVTNNYNNLAQLYHFSGDILLRKADIAVAGMIRNFDREQVVDFTAPYMDYGVGILIRKSNAEINIFSFLGDITALSSNV